MKESTLKQRKNKLLGGKKAYSLESPITHMALKGRGLLGPSDTGRNGAGTILKECPKKCTILKKCMLFGLLIKTANMCRTLMRLQAVFSSINFLTYFGKCDRMQIIFCRERMLPYSLLSYFTCNIGATFFCKSVNSNHTFRTQCHSAYFKKR